MHTRFMTVTFAAGLAIASAVAAPTPQEIHQHVFDHLKAMRDFLVPAPAIRFVETFPPTAAARQGVFQLAQVDVAPTPVEAPALPPPPEPPIDPAGIANFAQEFAVSTTQRVLDGFFPRSSVTRKPVIVGGDLKNIAPLEEDLTVMARILEKAAGAKADAPATAAGIEIFSVGKPGSPRAFYLDGYGALFVVSVRYPLLAPPKPDEQSRTNNTSSEWEQARQEVYGRRGALDDLRLHAAPAEEFDETRVENLKSQLLNDLSHARNIRNLKADDYITVVVLGSSPREVVSRRSTRPRTVKSDSHVATVETAKVDGAAQSIMTLRAKKSDIDAFGKGKLDAAEFKKKVSVQVY